MLSSSASIASRRDDANAAGSIPSSPSPQAGTGAPAASTLIPKWIKRGDRRNRRDRHRELPPVDADVVAVAQDRASRSERPHGIGHDRGDHALEEDPLDEIDLEALHHQVEHVRGADDVRLRPVLEIDERRALHVGRSAEDDGGVVGDSEARAQEVRPELRSVVRLTGIQRDPPREPPHGLIFTHDAVVKFMA